MYQVEIGKPAPMTAVDVIKGISEAGSDHFGGDREAWVQTMSKKGEKSPNICVISGYSMIQLTKTNMQTFEIYNLK